jgi:hypothetical protein
MLDKHDIPAYEGIGFRKIARGLAMLALVFSDAFVPVPAEPAEPRPRLNRLYSAM